MSDDEIVFLVTGSQGESRAALSQMATQSYKGLMIEEGDTVVLSARIIPGNERLISRMIGFIYKRGANIIEEKRRLDSRQRARFAGRHTDHDGSRASEVCRTNSWRISNAVPSQGIRKKPSWLR